MILGHRWPRFLLRDAASFSCSKARALVVSMSRAERAHFLVPPHSSSDARLKDECASERRASPGIMFRLLSRNWILAMDVQQF